LNNANAIITENQAALHKAIEDLAVFTGALARNSDSIDDVVNNTKKATASIRDLTDHLDKRTDEITTGVNKMTETATKQINIVGGDAHRAIINIDKAVTDLAKNPQRLLFGGGEK
jgi:phospholipid/cholesterol/gamma-HCH transport system substrate-binding protein